MVTAPASAHTPVASIFLRDTVIFAIVYFPFLDAALRDSFD
jgi:hypothetical protein